MKQINAACGNVATLLAVLAILALQLADLLTFQWKNWNDFFLTIGKRFKKSFLKLFFVFLA